MKWISMLGHQKINILSFGLPSIDSANSRKTQDTKLTEELEDQSQDTWMLKTGHATVMYVLPLALSWSALRKNTWKSCSGPNLPHGQTKIHVLSQNQGQNNQERAWFQVGHIVWARLYFVTRNCCSETHHLPVSCPMSFLRQNGAVFINRDHVPGFSTVSSIPQTVVSCFPGEGLAYLSF
jgi:hypothetical protein